MKKKSKIENKSHKAFLKVGDKIDNGKNEDTIEELLFEEKVRECLIEGDDDYKNVIERRILF